MIYDFEVCCDPREGRARRELYIARRILGKAKARLEMQTQLTPDRDLSMLEQHVDKAQLSYDSFKVIVDAYNKDRAEAGNIPCWVPIPDAAVEKV